MTAYKKIYAGCFPFKMSEAELKNLFVPYGEVKTIELFSDFENAEFDSFCYVYMEPQDADKAIIALDGKQLKNRCLKVNEAPVRKEIILASPAVSTTAAALADSEPLPHFPQGHHKTDSVDITGSIRIFEFIMRYLWPRWRILNRKYLTPRCQQCSISSYVPGIKLRDGICNKCQDFNMTKKDSEEIKWEEKYLKNQRRKLDELLRSYQGNGRRRYDALMLFSGGKDSTYLLYKIRTDYPALRILAMTWNNGFYSPVALDTVAQIAKRLDVEHILYKPRSSLFKNLYRYTLTHVNESGSYGTVDRLDGTLNQHLGIRFAAELEIPLVISGCDWAQALLMGSCIYFEAPRDEMLSRTDAERMARRSRLPLKEIFSPQDLDLYWDGNKWPEERIPNCIAPYIALRPDSSFIAAELSRLGLVAPAHTSPLLTNNAVLPIMTAIDIKKLGYCSFEPEFSDMVRLQHANAAYWRNVFELSEYLVKKNLFLNKSFLSVLGQLNLTKKDVGL